MRCLGCLLIAFCLQGAFAGEREEEEVNTLLQEVNNHIEQQGWDVIQWEWRQSVLPLFDFYESASIGNFSTLKLAGHPATIDRVDTDNATVYNYDVSIGLDSLLLLSRFNLKILGLGLPWKTIIHINNESVRLRGTITKEEHGGCQATVDQADIESLGYFDIKFRDNDNNDSLPVFLGTVAEIIVNQIKPYYRSTAQYHFDQVVKPILTSSGTSDLICQYFKPL